MLSSFREGARVAVFGATGGVGRAFVEHLEANERVAEVYACARAPEEAGGKTRGVHFDLRDEASIEAAVATCAEAGPLDLVLIATGALHDEGLKPEKTWRHLDAARLADAFAVNAIGPALIAKHAAPHLAGDGKSVLAALSARVGSISDNGFGGWHGYRASKAALNMLLRNVAIELGRKNEAAIVAALHPGTVDTDLSAPFQANVPEGKLFTPAYAAERLLAVVDGLRHEDSGGFFAWDGKPVPY